MKKSYFALIVIFALSVFYYSCNKDNPVYPGSSSSAPVTNKYVRNINKFVPNVDTLNISDNGSMLSLKFSLDTVLAIDGAQKLDVLLMHNNIVDTLIKQFTNPGIPSYNFRGCVCSDSATGYFTPGLLDYTGNYKPYSPLSVFNGSTLNGPWYLVFNYSTLNRTGVIKSWSITITYNVTQPTTTIFPLAVGNYWVFAVDTGSVSNVATVTLNISEQTRIHGQQVFKWQWQNNANYWYVKNESDGLWWYGSYNGSYLDTITSPFLWMKYPINLNERYITKQWMSNSDTITCTGNNASFFGYTGCIQYSESQYLKKNLNIISGSLFNPDYFKGINNTISGDFYFKPGTGYVGNEVHITSPVANFFQRYRLTSYHVQ
jgi:hypothetical protein